MYKIFKKIIVFFYKKNIIGKKIKNFNSYLFYEVSQHLIFFFNNEIEYEKNIWNHIKHLIKRGDLIFDIGANIGQYTLRFSEVVTESGRIISVEPDSKNFAFLNFNLNINSINNVIPLKLGLSDKPGNLTFYRDVTNGGRYGSFIKTDNCKDNIEVVEISTFDNLINKFGVPDFIKVDVEGFEVECLKGLTYLSKKTKYLFEVRESTKKEIFEIFFLNNFNCFSVDCINLIKINNSEEIPEFADLLFTYE